MAFGSTKKTIFASIGANLAIAITKFIAAAISGSSAMLSEGIHSLVDTGNELVLLLGIRQSQKPADAHGQELYFWTLIVAILLFAVGGRMSIYRKTARKPRPVLSRSGMKRPLVRLRTV